jgi:hypothetical protein
MSGVLVGVGDGSGAAGSVFVGEGLGTVGCSWDGNGVLVEEVGSGNTLPQASRMAPRDNAPTPVMVVFKKSRRESLPIVHLFSIR